VHRLVKAVRGRSSRLLREEFACLRSRLPTLWTNSSFAAIVGGASLEQVKWYVERQKNV
jgi:putative transposase